MVGTGDMVVGESLWDGDGARKVRQSRGMGAHAGGRGLSEDGTVQRTEGESGGEIAGQRVAGAKDLWVDLF